MAAVVTARQVTPEEIAAAVAAARSDVKNRLGVEPVLATEGLVVDRFSEELAVAAGVLYGRVTLGTPDPIAAAVTKALLDDVHTRWQDRIRRVRAMLQPGGEAARDGDA